jgi:hypothetical protein
MRVLYLLMRQERERKRDAEKDSSVSYWYQDPHCKRPEKVASMQVAMDTLYAYILPPPTTLVEALLCV